MEMEGVLLQQHQSSTLSSLWTVRQNHIVTDLPSKIIFSRLSDDNSLGST